MKNEQSNLKDHCIYLSGGQFSESYGDADVSRILDKFFESRKEHLLVYFHGGLVSRKKAEKQIKDTLFFAFNKPNVYPVFFIWETGIQETVKNNLTDGTLFSLVKSDLEELFKNRLAKIIKEKVSQYVISKLKEEVGLKGFNLKLESRDKIHDEIESYETRINDEYHLNEEPFRDVLIPEKITALTKIQEDQFKKDIEKDLGVKNSVKQIIKESSSQVIGDADDFKALNYFDEFEYEIQKEVIENKDTKGIISAKAILELAIKSLKIYRKVILRVRNGTDHDIYPTIVEEMFREFYVGYTGTKVWELIKGDAEKAFGKKEVAINQYLYGGLSFVNLLLEKSEKANYKPSINFVGHSAGSIFVYHMISSINSKPFSDRFKMNVFLMAPACTTSLFSNLIDKYWFSINNFRIYNLYDEYEMKDRMLGYLYPRSILYFVSGLLEGEVSEPILGLERFYQNGFLKIKNQELKNKIIEFYSKNKDSIIWLPIKNETGETVGPTTHGGFDDSFMLNILISDIINFTRKWQPVIMQS